MNAVFASLTSAHALLLLLSMVSLTGVLVGVTPVPGWIGQATVVAVSVLVVLLGTRGATPDFSLGSEGTPGPCPRFPSRAFADRHPRRARSLDAP